jgi:hypothetical protein
MIIPDTVAMKPAKTAIPVARHETSCKEATKMVQEKSDFVQSVNWKNYSKPNSSRFQIFPQLACASTMCPQQFYRRIFDTSLKAF